MRRRMMMTMTYCRFPIFQSKNEDIHIRDVPMVGRVHGVKIKCARCLEECWKRLVYAKRW